MTKTITLWSHGSNMQIEYENRITSVRHTCLLYTSDAADE